MLLTSDQLIVRELHSAWRFHYAVCLIVGMLTMKKTYQFHVGHKHNHAAVWRTVIYTCRSRWKGILNWYSYMSVCFISHAVTLELLRRNYCMHRIATPYKSKTAWTCWGTCKIPGDCVTCVCSVCTAACLTLLVWGNTSCIYCLINHV